MNIVSAQSELMPNHVAGQIMPEQQDVQMLASHYHEPILFALDDAHKLTLTFPGKESPTGWIHKDIALDGKSVIHAFSVVQDRQGDIQMVLAAAPAEDQPSCVYVTSSMPLSDIAADKWKSQTFAAGTLNDAVVKHFTIGIIDDSTSPLIVAATMLSDGTMEHQMLSKNTDNVWTSEPVALPQNVTCCKAITVGSTQRLGLGVYALCMIQETPSLTFTTMPRVYNGHPVTDTLELSLPDELLPNSIATVSTEGGHTELYVAGKGGLYRYRCEEQVESNMQDAARCIAAELTDVSKVKVTRDTSGIDVWAINSNKELLHVSGVAFDDDYRWMKPVRMETGVTVVSAYRAIDHSDNTVQAGLLLGKTGGSLALQTQDSVTHMWQPQTLSIPSSMQTVTNSMNTYTTRVVLSDKYKIALPNKDVNIQPDLDCAVLINGEYVVLKKSQQKVAKTDAHGSLTIVLEVNDLAAPTYTINFQGVTLKENPSELVYKTLRGADGTGISADEIAAAQRSNGTRLFPPVSDKKKYKNASKVVRDLVRVHDSLVHAAVQPDVTSSFGIDFSSGTEYMDHATVMSLDLDAVSVTAGDFFKSVATYFDKVEKFIVKKTSAGWLYVAHMGKHAMQFVFRVASHITNAINCALQKTLKITMNDVVDWLGFVFNWNDIKRNHMVIKSVVMLGIDSVIAEVNLTRDSVKNMFDSAKKHVKERQHNLDLNAIDRRTREALQQDDHPSYASPQSNWGMHKLAVYAKNIPVADNTTTYNLQDLDIVIDQNDRIIGKSEQLRRVVVEKIAPLYSELTWHQVFDLLLHTVGEALIDGVENITLAFLDSIGKIMELFGSFLYSRIEVPVLTYMLEKVIFDNDGTQCTLLDLICMLVAIPSTIVFKVLFHENIFPDKMVDAILSSTDLKSMIEKLKGTTSTRSPVRTSMVGTLSDTGSMSDIIRTAAAFQFLTAVPRIVSAQIYAMKQVASLVPGSLFTPVVIVLHDCGLVADWITYAFGVISSACSYVSSDKDVFDKFDLSVSTIQVLVCLRDSYVSAGNHFLGRAQSMTPTDKVLSVVESFLGLGTIVYSTVSLVRELKEGTPPKISKSFHYSMISFEFIQSVNSGFYGVLAAPVSLFHEWENTEIELPLIAIRVGNLELRGVASIVRASLEIHEARAS